MTIRNLYIFSERKKKNLLIQDPTNYMKQNPSRRATNIGQKLNDYINFALLISESASSNANCKDAGKQTPTELSEVNDPAFSEPIPGTKPSNNIKIRDINTDKLERRHVKGAADLVTTKDSQAASLSGQSVCEPLNKTKLLKKQVPGSGGFCSYQ